MAGHCTSGTSSAHVKNMGKERGGPISFRWQSRLYTGADPRGFGYCGINLI